jgi:hypothetical protein
MAKLVVIDQVNWRDSTMRGRKPNSFRIRPGDKSELLQIAGSPGLPWFQVQRARIVLARGAGKRTAAVADQFQCDEATVWRACRRYGTNGVVGLLADGRKEHSGRQATISLPPARSDRRAHLLGTLGQGIAYHPLAWIPTGKKTANNTTGSPAYFPL